jgi:acetoin utilization deacetylase AcuC-like enzyme
MDIIYNEVFLTHDTGMHPETPKRLLVCGDLPQMEIENGEKYLELVHTREYIDKVKKASSDEAHLDEDTKLSKNSYNAAIYAVGAAVMASHKNGIALVRPPGHHAYPDHASGFCLFNNIAIATQNLVNQGKKVLIIDIDSHLGDGTMKFFYGSDKVMYCSLHQDPAFPGGGNVDEIGQGQGRGYTVNIPLSPGSGDDIYQTGFEQVLNIGKQFSPDVIAISAGFDGHQKDPLLQLRLSVNTYYIVGKLITENFSNIFATLEGGYDLNNLPKCLFNFLAGVNGQNQPYKEPHTDSGILLLEDFDLRMDRLKSNLKKYWQV